MRSAETRYRPDVRAREETPMPGTDRTSASHRRKFSSPASFRMRIRLRSAAAPALLVLALAAGVSSDASADDHDARRAGHPVRIAAYLLHPVGVALDWLIVRPAHWVVEREPFRTIFGHEPD